MKKKKILIPAFFLAILTTLLMAVTVSAAEKPKYTNKWVRENGYNYHYNEKGKKDKGLIVLKGKTYYLDSKRIQRTGWQKIDNDYYFFQVRNGSYGYMVTDSTVNGIELRKNGKAKRNSSNAGKIDAMIKANKIMESITNNDMPKATKLKKCFDHLLSAYKKKYVGSFQKNKPDWDSYYANLMYDRKAGDCYPFGCAFAYLANAVGYENVYAMSSGGHGWCEVNGLVYDPSWDIAQGRRGRYFALNPNTYRGWPNYKASRKYVKKI